MDLPDTHRQSYYTGILAPERLQNFVLMVIHTYSDGYACLVPNTSFRITIHYLIHDHYPISVWGSHFSAKCESNGLYNSTMYLIIPYSFLIECQKACWTLTQLWDQFTRTFVCLGCYPIGPKISFEYDFDSINNKWSCFFQSQNKWTWKPKNGQEWGWLLSLLPLVNHSSNLFFVPRILYAYDLMYLISKK